MGTCRSDSKHPNSHCGLSGLWRQRTRRVSSVALQTQFRHTTSLHPMYN